VFVRVDGLHLQSTDSDATASNQVCLESSSEQHHREMYYEPCLVQTPKIREYVGQQYQTAVVMQLGQQYQTAVVMQLAVL
jgi:hypothetical protein